jgi:hypothetical protein
VIVVPNFYVRTEQPEERTERQSGWRRLFENAHFTVERVGADFGPPILGTTSVVRRTRRLAGRMLSIIPGLQYQFVFVLSRR